MKRISASFLPPIALDYRNAAPMYRQLYDWFRKAIIRGQLRPGQRVPSTRSLADELKISRIPVLNAYEQLLAEGYLETFVGAGTCVARSIPDDTLSPLSGKTRTAFRDEITPEPGPRRMSRRGVALTKLPTQSWLNIVGAFRVSLPALDHFQLMSGRDWWRGILESRPRASWDMATRWDICPFEKPLQSTLAQFVRCAASHLRLW